MNQTTRRTFLHSGFGAAVALRVFGQGAAIGERANAVVLRNTTIIDVRGGKAVPGMTVSIAGSRIQDVGPAAKAPALQDASIIDGAGKFLMPGLWDMHAHPNDFFDLHTHEENWMFPLFLANGVTGVRVLWGLPDHHKWRTEISAGSRLGPRMVIASPTLDGPRRGATPPWRIVLNAEQGREAVRRAVQEGADFIKVYELLSRESYFAIAEQATKMGVPFGGHIPQQLTAAECSAAGQRSVEHLMGIARACTPEYEPWRQALLKSPKPDAFPMLDAQRRLDTFDISPAEAIAEVFRKNGTWLCPTRVTAFGLQADPSLAENPNLRYVTAKRKASWAERVNTPDRPLLPRFQRNNAEIMRRIHQAGVGILAGTDTATPYCVPGFAVHEELRLLVNEGLTPLEALRAATYGAAVFFGKTDIEGTVERGKVAELVLLNANPLDDIANARKIDTVITGGRIFRRPALEELLQTAEAAARA